MATANPWLGQGIGKKSKRGDAAGTRKQWSDDALLKVLNGHYTPRYTKTLHDLVKLALVTGTRLDELCALKPDDIQHRPDGWWLVFNKERLKLLFGTYQSMTALYTF